METYRISIDCCKYLVILITSFSSGPRITGHQDGAIIAVSTS